ncbi:hypothetical protein [Streptomyces rubiginosohelvolus]|uniref:Uncharacterized protein n=1 Tax=Streptomyces rubiginosohelvolus TaxID=67362 RepID=A0ABQ3CBI9_9ACTN|nr:hypothetical protein [Streptomyces pluricolorescens]GGZ83586.1 hypothetical protein GCM10010328_67310 [Streptomyces pluricolorescens]
MSTELDPREVEAAGPDDTAHPGEPPDPPERPHEPGARPTPLSRLLYP